MFHRTFPEIKISATLLWRTYKQCGVKFKFIHRGKKVIDYGNPYYSTSFETCTTPSMLHVTGM